MKRNYETCFFSEMYNIKTALGEILHFLEENNPSIKPEELNELRLIFTELLCNAVIHGNKQDMKKTVKVVIEVSDDALNATVSDEGQGFDYVSFLKDASSSENLTIDHGRGIYLVFSLTDSLSFNMYGNQIRFNKRMKIDG